MSPWGTFRRRPGAIPPSQSFDPEPHWPRDSSAARLIRAAWAGPKPWARSRTRETDPRSRPSRRRRWLRGGCVGSSALSFLNCPLHVTRSDPNAADLVIVAAGERSPDPVICESEHRIPPTVGPIVIIRVRCRPGHAAQGRIHVAIGVMDWCGAVNFLAQPPARFRSSPGTDSRPFRGERGQGVGADRWACSSMAEWPAPGFRRRGRPA